MFCLVIKQDVAREAMGTWLVNEGERPMTKAACILNWRRPERNKNQTNSIKKCIFD